MFGVRSEDVVVCTLSASLPPFFLTPKRPVGYRLFPPSLTLFCPMFSHVCCCPMFDRPVSTQHQQEMLGIPLLGAIPEDQQVIISTNRGEPLVLQKKLSLSGIAFENAARRLIGKQDYFVDVQVGG